MYLLEHGIVVVNDLNRQVIKDGSILVDDSGRIVSVGPSAKIAKQVPKGVERINLKHHLVFPGFVNAHLHSYQSLLRGVGVGLPLEEWLSQIKYPSLLRANRKLVNYCVTISLLETMRSGVTSVINNQDVFTDSKHIDDLITTTKQVGLRAIIARGIGAPPRSDEKWLEVPPQFMPNSPEKEIAITQDLISKYGNNEDPMSRIWLGPWVSDTLEPKDLKYAAEVALQNKSGIHIHVAEAQISQDVCKNNSGLREVEYLADCNALMPTFHCVHGVWLNDHERKLLADNRSTLVHNPACNSIIGSGIADLPKALAAGVPIALGTDSPAVNNTCNLIESLKLAVFLQRASNLNAFLIPAHQVVHMATHGGAHALGLSDQLGSLEPGRFADIIALNVNKAHAIPVTDPYITLVFALSGSDVDFVMVNGKIRIVNGELQDLNEVKLLNKARHEIQSFVDKIN